MDKAAFNFNKWNTIGWLTFGIALLTYTLTVEPTMSFGIAEYIATAAKLEVASGAPLYQMIGAFLPCLLPTIQNCLNGQYDVSLFQCLYHFYFGLHQSS
jgi:hypothetical protein